MSGWLRYERVNAAELDRALGTDAIRRFSEYNLFQVLLNLRRSATGWACCRYGSARASIHRGCRAASSAASGACRDPSK